MQNDRMSFLPKISLFDGCHLENYLVCKDGYVSVVNSGNVYHSGSINIWNGSGYIGILVKKIIMLTFSYRDDYENHEILNLNFDYTDNRFENLAWDDYTRNGYQIITLPAHEFDKRNEIWLPVANYGYMEDVKCYGYYISSNGLLYHAATNRYFNGVINRYGYRFTNFISLIDNKRKCKLIHRIVMNAFCYNENYNNLQINHIDGNKLNNNINNLEWCTSQYNSYHALNTGLSDNHFGENNYASVYTKEFIYFILDSYLAGMTGKAIIAKTLADSRFNYDNVSYQTISHVTTGISRQKEITLYLVEHGYTLGNLFGDKDYIINLCRQSENRYVVLNTLNIASHTPHEIAINLTFALVKNNATWIDYLKY